MSAGPQQREFLKEIPRAKQVGVRAPAKRFSTRKSTSKASWGAGPQQRDFQQENPQAKASWGAGPQQRDFQQENLQAKQAGVK